MSFILLLYGTFLYEFFLSWYLCKNRLIGSGLRISSVAKRETRQIKISWLPTAWKDACPFNHLANFNHQLPIFDLGSRVIKQRTLCETSLFPRVSFYKIGRIRLERALLRGVDLGGVNPPLSGIWPQQLPKGSPVGHFT